jgi:hypothetical protein
MSLCLVGGKDGLMYGWMGDGLVDRWKGDDRLVDRSMAG